MVQSGVKTTVNTIKTIKTIATASKAGVTVAKVGAKMSFMAAKLSNPIGWATMVFDITNIILDVANVGGYSDIGNLEMCSTKCPNTSDYFYTEGKDKDGQTIRKADTSKTRAECEQFCNTVDGCNGIITYTTDKNTKGECWAVRSVDNPYSKNGSAVAKRATYTNIGIGGCQKPSKWVGNTGYIYDVGVCPPKFPVKVDALCYKDASMAI